MSRRSTAKKSQYEALGELSEFVRSSMPASPDDKPTKPTRPPRPSNPQTPPGRPDQDSQLELFDDEPEWRLDNETVAAGRAGVIAARAVLYEHGRAPEGVAPWQRNADIIAARRAFEATQADPTDQQRIA